MITEAVTVALRFDAGTIELRGLPRDAETPPAVVWDVRAAAHRARAVAYAEVVRWLIRAKSHSTRSSGVYEEIGRARVVRQPRPFQTEALEAWTKAHGRGVVALATAAGKTHVAVMAID